MFHSTAFRVLSRFTAVALLSLCVCPADAQTTFFRDADGDGFGAPGSGMVFPSNPGPSYSLIDGDCDDSLASVFPDTFEEFNDCNTLVDDGTEPAVPEPTSFALLGLGAVLVATRRRR